MPQATPNSHIKPLEDFDWEAYESTGPKRFHNKNIKTTSKKDKVFSHGPSAQQLYDLINTTTKNLIIPVTGSILKGTIESRGSRYAYVDIGWRESAILDLHKENPKYIDDLVEGIEIDVVVKKSNVHTYQTCDLEVSFTEAIKHVKFQEIYSCIGKNMAFLANVTELIHGGYFLDVEGVRVFMPGSLGGVNKLVNFEELLGEDIYVCPINYSKEKDFVVVSHRAYLQALIPQALDAIDPGDSFVGFVTGSTKFGVFVEFNKCLTGLIHKTDLDDETSELFNSRSLTPGSQIEFTVKELTSNNRIILTQKEYTPVIDPWDNITDRLKVPSEIEGRIRKKTKYGLFIEVEPRVVGLLHTSDIPESIDINDLEEGETINVNLVKIETDSKKLFFKI